MAELKVEPKKKSSWLAWLLLILGIIALIVYLVRRNDDSAASASNQNSSSVDTSKSAGSMIASASAAVSSTVDKAWSEIKQNAPKLSYGEIRNKKVSVRGTGDYAIYDLGEDVSFDKDKSTIREDAVSNLKDVAASISKRFDKGQVRLYGFTDAQGSKAFNKELAQSRAEAVMQWLTANGNISKERLSIEAVGEENPQASNATEEGREQNRRVQIVAKKAA